MGDAQRSACGPKHSLRKAVNRLTGTKKTRKVPIIRGPSTGEALLHRSGRALGGRNLQADGRCLSVRLLGTTHWLTRGFRSQARHFADKAYRYPRHPDRAAVQCAPATNTKATIPATRGRNLRFGNRL